MDADWDNVFIAAKLESGHQLILCRLLDRQQLDRIV